MLTQAQVGQFHEEGYLFLPETFSATEVAILKSEAEKIYRQQRPKSGARNPAPRVPPSPRTCTMRRTACSPATR